MKKFQKSITQFLTCDTIYDFFGNVSDKCLVLNARKWYLSNVKLPKKYSTIGIKIIKKEPRLLCFEVVDINFNHIKEN